MLVTSLPDLVTVVDFAQIPTGSTGVMLAPRALTSVRLEAAAITLEDTTKETTEVEVDRDTDIEVEVEAEEAPSFELVFGGRGGGGCEGERSSDEGDEGEKFGCEHCG